VNTNKKAIAYLALAFNTMKLLRLVSKARSEDWPDSEAWKVMQSLTKKYHPIVLQVKVELQKMPGNEEKQDLNEEEEKAVETNDEETKEEKTNEEDDSKEDPIEEAEKGEETNNKETNKEQTNKQRGGCTGRSQRSRRILRRIK